MCHIRKATEARKPDTPGRARYKPSNHCVRECRAIPVYSLLLVCVLPLPSAHETAGAAGIRHSPRPLRAEDKSNASGASRRGGEGVSKTIATSLRAKRSNPARGAKKEEWIASLRSQ